MSVWRRIARLLDQSRIRLPAQPIRASELRLGDFVQIGGERWRVSGRRFEADRVVFRLRPGAVLFAPRHPGEDWILAAAGEERSVPPELLVVFPVV